MMTNFSDLVTNLIDSLSGTVLRRFELLCPSVFELQSQLIFYRSVAQSFSVKIDQKDINE